MTGSKCLPFSFKKGPSKSACSCEACRFWPKPLDFHVLYQHLHFTTLRKAGLQCSMQGDPQSPSHHTPGCPSSSACLRVFLCMSSSVMPWYTRVSFHTGLRVLRSVFVLSLFDYSIKTKHGTMTPLKSSPPKFQLLAEECKLDAPSPLVHKRWFDRALQDVITACWGCRTGEPSTPGEHHQPYKVDLYASTRDPVARSGQGSIHCPGFFIVWGLLPQEPLYKKKLRRAGCVGLGALVV